MSAARASGMDLASILKRNTFLTLEVRPARGPGSGGPRGTGGQRKGPGTGGQRMGPGTGYRDKHATRPYAIQPFMPLEHCGSPAEIQMQCNILQKILVQLCKSTLASITRGDPP